MRAPGFLADRSFRTRLTVTITGVFVLAGAALVAVVYLMMTGLLRGAIDSSGHSIAATPMTGTLNVQMAGPTGIDDIPPELSRPDPAVLEWSEPRPIGPAGAEFGAAGAPPPTGIGADSVMIVVDGGSATSADFLSATAGAGAAALPTEPLPGPVEWLPARTVQLDSGSVGTWFVGQSEQVADDVRGELLLWSGLALVLFAGAAAGIAAWLSRRAMRRIGEVTAMAKDMSTHDLHRRLDLPGPADEIKELADTIDDMLNRLEESFAARERFVANASHELRTPLTTARAALEIPLTQGRVPARLRPAVETALRAGRHSERLITSLLSLARGTHSDDRVEVDLADVVPATAAERAEQIRQVGIELELSSASAPVQADPVMAAQAVGNLIDNAIRYNVPDGQILIEVGTADATEPTSSGDSGRPGITVPKNGAFLAPARESFIRVSNTGRELAPEIVALLAEPFYRAESSRTSTGDAGGGAGLGLSIVRSICQAHGGRLELEPRDGGGLVATVVIPFRDPDPTTLPETELAAVGGP